VVLLKSFLSTLIFLLFRDLRTFLLILRSLGIALLLHLFCEHLHFFTGVTHILVFLVQRDQLWTDEACVVFIAEEISITRGHALQINDVMSLV
jgi:hypothetical protein